MALPADVLAKVLAFVPADLQMTSSLRVASKYAKERVDTRWWTAQVQDMKAFMDGHACLFAADPVSVEGNEDVSIEEQQEAFARNILLWVKPLLVNQPWSSEVHDHEVHHDDDDDDDDDATGEITPRAAHINLRRAMTNLSERRNGVLQDIRQQARFIEGRHLRQMEADMEDEAEMMTILMQQGISEEQAHAVCRQIQQRGLMDPSDRSDETSWITFAWRVWNWEQVSLAFHIEGLADHLQWIIAQLLTALVANEHGLSAMSALNLETPLVALLELPTATLRVPVMLVLCAMSSNQASVSKSRWFLHVHSFACYRPLGCYLMAFRADVLPKVLAFVPADLQMTSSLRVASQDAKERVDTRWWTAQVQCVKAFVYRHVILFADDPEIEDEDVTVEEQQETFARNILLWIKPLLVNQPWRSEVNDEEVRDDATGEITPQAAYRNLRTALTDLSERRNDVLRNIRQQARFIEGHHLRHSHTARQALHTMVSQTDRRQMEADMEDNIPPAFANLETSEMEIRSEDARSGSFAHTEMTREGVPRDELITICSRLGISIEVAQELLSTMEQRGLLAYPRFVDPSEGRSEAAESASSSQVMEPLIDPRLMQQGIDDGTVPDARAKDVPREAKIRERDTNELLLREGNVTHTEVDRFERNGAPLEEQAQSPLCPTATEIECTRMIRSWAALDGRQAVDKGGFTYLHWAARNGYETLVEQLLQAGDKEAVDENGMTCLHWAARQRHQNVVEQLLQAGANKEAVDENGELSGLNEEREVRNLIGWVTVFVLCPFLGVLRRMEKKLGTVGEAPPVKDEVEYLVCILDRSCCHPELAKIAQEQLFRLLCVLPSRAETLAARLMALRALSRCSFVAPECMNDFGVEGVACLQYIMAVSSCLSLGRSEKAEKAVADFDKLEGNKLEATAAELMNKLVALLHVLLCSMFRHGRPPHAYSKDPEEAKEKANGGFTDADVKPAVEGLMQVLDKVQALLLLGGTDQTGEQKPGSTYLADLLASDIRVLFYLTALLREASCKPLESPFLRVTRSTAYFDTLSACINLALKRFQRESKGPPPRDLCAKKGGPTDSPVSQHMDDFDLGLIFEHLIVCLRHTLVQAMYVAPEVSTKLLPWAWISQERLLMHREVMTWLPQIVKRYKEVSAIRTETLRYFACAASYECAPFARPEDAAFEIEDEKAAAGAPGAAVADDPTLGRMQVDADAAAAAAVADAAEAAAAEAAVATAVAEAGGVPTVGESEASEQGIRRPFGGLVSLRQSELRNFLAEELERSNDMYALCLSMLCVANFAAYERPGTTPGAGGHGTRKLGKHLPVEEMSRLLRGVIRVVKAIPTFEDVDVANTMTLHALRFICNLLAFEVDFITAELQHLNFLEEASKLFEYWFHDEDKIEDDKLYIQTLQSFILLLRNWSCGSCRAETKVRERKENASSKEERDSAGSLLKVFKSGINVPYLITLTMRFSKVLISGRRSVPNKEEEREKVIGDVLVILQTLLKRTDSLQNMNWEKVDIIDYENFLHIIKIHRLKTSDILEDEQILNTLYLMVKQAFPFKGLVFLEYLMEVAYGDHREEHTTLQDMAAVCCAIISTQNATDASTPTVNVASVVKDNAAFVHALERVPDPKMQIWHYRLLTGWSRRPKALDDLVGDTEALRFVVEHLLETHLCRYSVVIVHNISMLRSSALLTCPGHLSTICEAYRQLGPGATLHRGDEKQRRLVRRLLLAAVRNCLWNSSNVQKELHEDDMLNIINLVSCIEEADLPFFMAVILYISEGCEINRVREAMYGNAQLLELMVRCMYQQATACVVDLEEENKYESSMYGLITEEEAQRAERYDALMEHSEAIANAPKKQTEAYKKLLAIPGSPAARGLGKTASLYQRSRRKGTHPAAGVRGEVTMNTTGTASRKLSEVEERRGQQEFLYFAAVELLTYGTFAGDDHDRRFPPPPTAEPHRAEVAEALHKAFQRFTLQNFLKILAEQIQQHKKMKVVLSDMFMHVSTKFLWHCWTQPIFTGYVNTAQNLEILAQLVPFMISWPNHDVQMMIGDVCLYAGLHRFPAVCDILIAEYRDYPELSCAMLTRCMISPVEETGLRPKQAVNFLKIFVCLLRDRALSHTGLKRLAIGLETALLMDSPKACGLRMRRFSGRSPAGERFK
ncbi:unnamed protein product [Durusdinium trenchii]|uniref:Uncharacterized protein n=1 Tax=Durusdinium trenchii TaxID=1381693 RepID=A0ABP0N8H8_9DINO